MSKQNISPTVPGNSNLVRRRDLIRGALLAGVPTVASGADVPLSTPDGSAVAAVLPRTQNSERVGKHYLEQYPEDADYQFLVDALCSGKPADISLRSHLQKKIAGDYAAGDTVSLHGWMISRTEARTCAVQLLASKCV